MKTRCFVTTVLASVIVNFSYQPCAAGEQQATLDELLTNYSAPKQLNNEKLKEESKEFNKSEVIKVTDGVFVALGFGMSNSILIEAPEGAIIIDAQDSTTNGEKAYAALREVTKSPIRAIIYTHNHPDHVTGAKAFLKDSEGQHVDIWAHHTLMHYINSTHKMMSSGSFAKLMRQFGPLLPESKHINAGVGFRYHLDDPDNAGFVAPNKFLVEETESVNIAGLDLQLIHIPGESGDEMAIWYPDKKVLFCGDDFYKSFPNLYALRGTPSRSLTTWVGSIDKMRKLRPEFLVPGHTRPITGSDVVFKTLRDYRDAIQYVHDQTMRLINKNVHPDDIGTMVQLPKALASNPSLQEFYGTIPWSAKGVYSGSLGWFSGDPVDLNPHSTLERSKRLVQLGGGEAQVLKTAQGALDSNDPQWALELSSAALQVHPESKLARELKVRSLLDMSYTQKSAPGYNYYQTCAYEVMGKLKNVPPTPMRTQAIYSTNPTELLTSLSVRIKGGECAEIDKTVVFNFADTKTNASIHMRHGIWDLNPELPDPAKADLVLNTTLDVLHKIVALEKNVDGALAAGEIKLKGNEMDFKKIFGCIELDT